MTTYKRDFKDGVAQLAGVFGKDSLYIQFCNVDSVDETAQTCDCTPISGDQDTQIVGVLLNSESNPGFTLFPAVDSTVIVAISKKNIPFVLLCEEVYKISATINNTTLEITDGLVKFNGGSNDGLVLVNPLVGKLNNLENKVNDLITSYNSHTHTGVTAGGGTSGTTPSVVTGTLTPTTANDIKNTAITQ
jgi:hypothetical protein